MGTCCSATSARSLMITFAGVAASIIRRASRVSAAIEVALAQLNQIDTRSPRFRSLRDEFVELGLRILARCQTMSIGDEADRGSHGNSAA